MLKIKDSVDLAELEKLGFKNRINIYKYELISAEIIVDVKDRILSTLHVKRHYEYTEFLHREYTTIKQLKCLLPQLIDLVEEVKKGRC